MKLRRDHWLLVAVAVLSAVVFLPAVHGPWIFDDHQLIQGNPEMHSLSAASAWFTKDFWHGAGLAKSLVYWRPLVSASYALDWSIDAGQPLQFHLTNLLAHAAVAALVFATLRRWTATSAAAFAGAILWAVHPTKAETVAWISGRTDILCTAFVLVAAAGMARRLRGAGTSGLALEAVGTLGAYMSKELAVVLPIFAAVETWVAAGRPALDRTLARSIARAIVPQSLVAVGYIAVRAAWLPIGGASGAHGLANHARTVVETYGRFIALVFAPHQLSMQHGLVRPHDGSVVHSTPYEVLGAVALLATVAAIVVLRRRFTAGAVGIAVFVVTLAPTLNILQSNQQTLVAERFLYLPTFGLAFVVAALLAAIPVSAQRRMRLLLAAIALALVAQALSRAADFRDEDTFWARELRLHPHSPAALDYAISTPISAYVLEQIAQADSRDTDRATFAADVLDIFVRSVTDRDSTVLRDLDIQAAALLAHRTASTRLAALGITVVIDTSKDFADHLPQVAARIHAARAELAGRGGDPVAARAAATAELRACGNCDDASGTLALAEARAAAFGPPADADTHFARALELARTHADLANRIAEARQAAAANAQARGAAQLQARASELSALGLWGAAFKVLEPGFDEITKLPDAAIVFAKLAFRAGETAIAADALASAMPAEQIRGTLEAWAREAGWLPTSAGGPSSP